MQAYSNLDRETDPHALPDIEIFEAGEREVPLYNEEANWVTRYLDPGWYWVACFPGCLWDGEPSGPFATREEALQSAQCNSD